MSADPHVLALFDLVFTVGTQDMRVSYTLDQ